MRVVLMFGHNNQKAPTGNLLQLSLIYFEIFKNWSLNNNS